MNEQILVTRPYPIYETVQCEICKLWYVPSTQTTHKCQLKLLTYENL